MGLARLVQAQPREQAPGGMGEILWHGITAPSAIRVATQQPGGRQPAAASRAVLTQRLQCISRTARLKAAGATQPRLEEHPVEPDKAQEAPLRQRLDAGPHGAQPARLNKPSSSSRAASASAADRAETNSVVAKPARSRTSHIPPGSRLAWRTNEARICRLSKLRVTARRAWRLGTTLPIQSTAGGLSTGDCNFGTRAVDKSALAPLFFRGGAGKERESILQLVE